ncbi:MAG: cation:proton antiporter, partial [Candidatus Competibacterales bacterium]
PPIAWGLGIDLASALVVGGALAMSSTAIVVKQLTDQLELKDQHGRFSLGILLFQDLAAVPFLVVIPILAVGGEGGVVGPLAFALVKGIVALAVMLLIGHWALRPLFHEVAASRSAELFTLTVLLVSLLAAWSTALMGLSLALGAFFAGMMLSETEYRHQIDSDIRPFRDVFLGLFFVSVGLSLNVDTVLAAWPWVLGLTLGLCVGKGLYIALLTYYFTGGERQVAWRTGFCLAHGGEFGIALLALAWQQGLITGDELQPVLAAVIISMALAPLLIRFSGTLSRRLVKPPATPAPTPRAAEIEAVAAELEHHVLLCGHGRVGQQIASALAEEGIEYLALDLDPKQIRAAWDQGRAVYFGDAGQGAILQAAGLARARAVVVSFHDVQRALALIHHVRHLRADIPILVRAQDETAVGPLLEAGATDVVPETVEAGVMLAAQVLMLLDRTPEAVLQHLHRHRGGRYRVFESLGEDAL